MKRENMLRVRVTDRQLAAYQAEAEAEGVSLSEWVRLMLAEGCKRAAAERRAGMGAVRPGDPDWPF